MSFFKSDTDKEMDKTLSFIYQNIGASMFGGMRDTDMLKVIKDEDDISREKRQAILAPYFEKIGKEQIKPYLINNVKILSDGTKINRKFLDNKHNFLRALIDDNSLKTYNNIFTDFSMKGETKKYSYTLELLFESMGKEGDTFYTRIKKYLDQWRNIVRG